jgi:hypothetical protein
MRPNINSVEVHPQLSNNGDPVDGALVGAGLHWLACCSCQGQVLHASLFSTIQNSQSSEANSQDTNPIKLKEKRGQPPSSNDTH